MQSDDAYFDNTFMDTYSTGWSLLYFQRLGSLYIRNFISSNATPLGGCTITLNLCIDVYFDNILFDNYTGATTPIFPTIISSQVNAGVLELKNFTVSNSVFLNQNLLGGNPDLSTVLLSDITVNNSTINAGIEMFFLFSIHKLDVSGFTVSETFFSDSTDTETSLVTIDQLDLANTYENTISGITYSNSSVTVIKISKFINTPSVPKPITYTHSLFSSSVITSPRALIPLNSLTSTFDIQFSFQNITFDSITYSSSGPLFEFDHQLVNNVLMTDCVMSNIQNGYVRITTPATSNTAIFTKVVIDNLSVDGVKETSNSLITLAEQGKVQISNSEFKNIYSFGDGAVLSGGASKTESVVEHTMFYNNTAQKGAVFYLSDESSVICTNCTIYDNYAVVSGVIEVTLNGYFEFYQSQIYRNYANSNPVSLILDSASLSIIND